MKIFERKFGEIYSLYLAKVEKKGRTADELRAVIQWLTGYTPSEVQQHIENSTTMYDFFISSPFPNINKALVKGSICGVKIDEVEDPIEKDIRILDKLVDELAKGKAMDKILK